jgi:NDP-sugar pyrophosphorylase family protein
MKQRNLTPDEIYLLEKQGCNADDWMSILVTDAFKSEQVWHTTFEGENILGSFSENSKDQNNVIQGIFYSRIINCEIGDQTRISHVNRLENYKIGNNCILEDIGLLTVTGETTFGNGTEVEVLNEAGGRSLPIFDKLSAQVAWLVVKCRHDVKLNSKLKKLVAVYAETKRSNKGTIGDNAVISHCVTINNVSIGNSAQVVGVQSLDEGTILSDPNAITKIGNSVQAKDFIIQEGSNVSGGAILDKCFVGQSVLIGKQFSAENSAFFANSECYHGEACSIFAGPYTVTHHKSSLLIAGQFSFYNAGSGTNQSNHMYKLGPIHQGIVERGSKTGSFSYLLWPSKVGPYSVVMGKHSNNIDASDFPFSYITEEHAKSILTPAMNLFTVGTKRDVQKWPARDKRKYVDKYDNIIFDLYSPYIIQKVIKAINQLADLYQKTPKEKDLVFVQGLYLHRLMLKTCRKYYELALQVFLGEGMIVMLNDLTNGFSIAEFQQKAKAIGDNGIGEWLDVAGLFMPFTQLEVLEQKLEKRKISSLQDLQDYFSDQFKQYKTYKASAFKKVLKDRRGVDLSHITSQQIIRTIEDWRSASLKLNNMILKDAEKEFDATSRLGYGISSDVSIRDADFENVHGRFEDNGFVKELKTEIQMVNKKAEEIIQMVLGDEEGEN